MKNYPPFYHYTSGENAEAIEKSKIFRLSDINETTDHTEGYHTRIEELYPDLTETLGDHHYQAFQEYRKQMPLKFFFGSLTVIHEPTDCNNPLWRKYAVKDRNDDKPKFGTGACVEFEFDFEDEFDNELFSEFASINSNGKRYYLSHHRDSLTEKDFLGQTVFSVIRYLDVNPLNRYQDKEFEDLKNKVDEAHIEMILKFCACAWSYFCKSLAHKAEHEIRVLFFAVNEKPGDDKLISQVINMKIKNVHLHYNPIAKKISKTNFLHTIIKRIKFGAGLDNTKMCYRGSYEKESN